MRVRRFSRLDAGRLWALNNLPNAGETADPTMPLELPIPLEPPASFPHLADVERHFLNAGGEFLVAEQGAHLVGMGGIRPNSASEAEVLHIRVHPATRRQGVGRLLMNELEGRARDLGFRRLHLDTATNQPDAVAFYGALGYMDAGTETKPSWAWTLQYFTKSL
jgi:ribosomal protein S18 acetylase RimI-like enzyme